MRIYIGQGLSKRQGWIFGLLQEGRSAEYISLHSRYKTTIDEIKGDMQIVLDKTDFLGQARPNSYVMTSHAYQRLFERYPEGLTGKEIEELFDNALNNGRRLDEYRPGYKKLTWNDITWVIKGNKIITVYYDEKLIRQRLGLTK
jgi:hypothetical protein